MKLGMLLLGLIFSACLWADDLRPASLTIQQVQPSAFDISWTVPLKNGVRPDFSLKFSGEVRQTSPKIARQLNNTSRESWRIESNDALAGLAGQTITIVGLRGSTYEVLLRLVDENSQTITAVLNTDKPDYVVPAMDSVEGENTIIAYIGLGIEHILIGLDHLLFVACLVYISRTRRKLLLTITGFTIAHSVTLILAATEVLVIPIPPVEAVIALSIVFLAWEIAKNRDASLSLKYPILVSSSFGLLHGFGFASVLADIGLPEGEKLSALLCFNIGVEIGQLLFVASLFLVFWALKKLYQPLSMQMLRFPTSYACGVLATFWMFERLAAF
jgi:hydrogenase/urease accessory protein HupE